MLFVSQVTPHGEVEAWECRDEADAIRLIQTEYDQQFETANAAVAYDKQAAAIEPCPAHLLFRLASYPDVEDAVLDRWATGPQAEVDLENVDEWGPGTEGGARIAQFQRDSKADLDGAELGRVEDFDVIFLATSGRAARVSNGNAEWFDAASFRHASLFAVGEWDGEYGR